MAKATTTTPGRAKRPRERRHAAPEPRYQSSESPSERRRPGVAGSADSEPRLGPYEFRYPVAFGYSSPLLG